MLNLLMLSLEETLLQLTNSPWKPCCYYFITHVVPVLLMVSFYTSLQITHGILMHWE